MCDLGPELCEILLGIWGLSPLPPPPPQPPMPPPGKKTLLSLSFKTFLITSTLGFFLLLAFSLKQKLFHYSKYFKFPRLFYCLCQIFSNLPCYPCNNEIRFFKPSCILIESFVLPSKSPSQQVFTSLQTDLKNHDLLTLFTSFYLFFSFCS